MNKNINDKFNNTRTMNSRIMKISIFIFIIVTLTSCQQPAIKDTSIIEHVYTQHENGSTKEVGILQDSVKQGLWIKFYPTGKIEFISFYQDGKQTGHQRSFWENGKLASYREMRDDMFHGRQITYYRNGQIAGEYFVINDTIDGIITGYSEDGEIDRQIEYRKGEYVRTIVGVEHIIE